MKKFLRRILKPAIVLFILMNLVVIMHAYKFTHFYEAGTLTPATAPKSWFDKGKEMLTGINAMKIKPQASDTIFTKVELTTEDNIRLSAWQFSVAQPKGTVAIFHGHGSQKSANIQQSQILNRLGYNTILTDFRAHGESSGNTCTIGYDETKDVKAVYDYLQKQGEKNIILYGISLGASTIAKSIADYHLAPSKVMLEMPFASLHQAVQGRIKMMGLPAQPLSAMLTFWGGTMHGFWAFNLQPSEYVRSINCPVLLQWGANDTRVLRNETDSIYAHITASKKLVVYENSSHENLCKSEQAKWIENVKAFLQ